LQAEAGETAPEVGPDPDYRSRLRQDYAYFSDPVSSEISDFTQCMHAQSYILHTKYVDKTDY